MTRSLCLNSDGDLAIVGRKSQLVEGREKLKQDLSCWLRENYQVDRFHRGYGSTLDSYIGGVISGETLFYIRSEVIRVLNNYQQILLRRIQEKPSLFSPGQILTEVVDVDVKASYDTVTVDIQYRVASGQVDQVRVGVSV